MRNIGSSDDLYHRYKRSSVEVTYKNTGKGQTVIENINKICHQLETKPENLIKYLKKQVNATFDNDGIIHAKVDKEKIETSIDKYIELYVLCPRCKLPEYQAGYCKACGYSISSSNSSSTSSLCDRAEKVKFLAPKMKTEVALERDKMLKDLHDCMNEVSKQPKEETAEMKAEQQLVEMMKKLYEYYNNKDVDNKNEAAFLIDCAWEAPDICDLVSEGGKIKGSSFILNLESLSGIIQKWLDKDELTRKIVRVLTTISTKTENEAFDTEGVENERSTKALKSLYFKHIKQKNIVNQWMKTNLQKKVDKIIDSDEKVVKKAK